MSSKNEKFDDIIATVEDRVLEQLHAFHESFQQATEAGGAPTIDQVEQYWHMLDLETKKIYISMISDYLSAIDERKMIDEKKGNC